MAKAAMLIEFAGGFIEVGAEASSISKARGNRMLFSRRAVTKVIAEK